MSWEKLIVAGRRGTWGGALRNPGSGLKRLAAAQAAGVVLISTRPGVLLGKTVVTAGGVDGAGSARTNGQPGSTAAATRNGTETRRNNVLSSNRQGTKFELIVI